MRTPPALVALTPGRLTAAEVAHALAALRSATAAGLRGLVVREARLADRELLAFAREAAAVLRTRPRAWLAVHDRIHVALAVEADAVHLGFRSLTPETARRLVPAGMAVGLSTHAGDPTERWRAADYLFHGPVNPTPSKAGLVDPVGTAGLAAAVARSPVPVHGIGGLEPEDGPAVRAAGAAGLAVLRGILGAADPGARTARYLAGWEGP